jgi:hypothetical protein
MSSDMEALVLRLAASEARQEAHSIIVLRRTLRDRGMSDLEQHAAVKALRQALASIVLTQESLFDKAA